MYLLDALVLTSVTVIGLFILIGQLLKILDKE